MSETKTFSVEIPEKPTGKSLAVCFESLISQMINAKSLNSNVTRFRINKETKRIEIEVKED